MILPQCAQCHSTINVGNLQRRLSDVVQKFCKECVINRQKNDINNCSIEKISNDKLVINTIDSFRIEDTWDWDKIER